MYAILNDRGKQYKVQQGDLLQIDKLHGDPGAKVEFTDVLVVGKDGGDLSVGAPYLKGAAVVGELIEHAKGEKTIAHHRVRTNSLGRRRGHRMQFTVVKINSITA